jgi:hypothetical protein
MPDQTSVSISQWPTIASLISKVTLSANHTTWGLTPTAA